MKSENQLLSFSNLSQSAFASSILSGNLNKVSGKFSREEKELHESYMNLMAYLQSYKESICYEAQGMLPEKNERMDPDFEESDDVLAVEEIWPLYKSGRKKGEFKPQRDTKGNIVVDPAGNIVKNRYLLDFEIYRAL